MGVKFYLLQFSNTSEMMYIIFVGLAPNHHFC